MRALKTIKRKIKTVKNKPQMVLIKLLNGISPIIPDKLYLQLLFPLQLGYRLDLQNPQTYNEKLQWLKLYYRKPIMNKLVDKYEVKQYIKEKVGDRYIIKNYGIWNSFDEIDFENLPKQFVLKTTHDQGGVFICKNKTQFDFNKARRKINKHLKKNLFYKYREWPYKDVKARIIAEEYIVNENKKEIDDYKFFCFGGVPKVFFIATDRQTGKVKFNYYDMNFKELDIVQKYKKSNNQFKKPENFELMVELTKKIASDFPHIRIDLYNVNGRIYFGETTFYHHSGLKKFSPKKWDYVFGNYIKLPNSF